MRRLLAVLLSSALASSAPAQTLTAPAVRTSAPVAVAPIPGSGFTLSLSPAAVPAGLPAPSLAPSGLPAATLMPPVAVPLAAEVKVKGLTPVPAPVSAAAPERVRAISQLIPLPAASAFDGGRERREAVEPAGTPRAPGPRLEKPRTAYGALKKGLGLGALAAAAAPVVWHAAPLHGMALTFGLPAAALLGAWVLRGLWRLARRIAGRPAPKPAAAARPARLRALLAGLLIGASLSVGTFVEQPRVVETGASVFAPKAAVRRVEGRAMPEAVIRELSGNPVGRDVLRELTDRSGVVRLPAFYVYKPGDSAIGLYVSVVDGVFVDEELVKGMGLTVDEFLADPAAQARFVERQYSLFVHELRHTDQYRRRPAAWQFREIMQVEHEAYMTEHFYAHERLRAAPEKGLDNEWLYRRILEDPEAYLDDLHEHAIYKKNSISGDAYWTKWRAGVLAGWPAHKVEAYVLLAKSEAARGSAWQARQDLESARAAAKAAGLPEPDFTPP